MDRCIPGWRAAAVFLLCALLAACAPSELHQAAARGDVAAVRSWIAAGRGVDGTFDSHTFRLEGNYAAARGVRPLMLASHFGHLDVVRALVEAGADIYAESTCAGMDCRRNAFDYAIENEKLDVARYLLDKGDRRRLVQRAEGQLVSLCLRHCAERAGQDAQTNIALFLAQAAPRDQLGRAIGRIAAGHDGPARLDFLRTHGIKIPSNVLHELARQDVFHLPAAQREEQLRRAADLIRGGADPNDDSWVSGVTPLMLAAMHHNLDMIRLLVASGANVDQRGDAGRTAVSSALGSCSSDPVQQQRQLETLDFLLASGGSAKVPEDSMRFLRQTCCTAARRSSAPQDQICRRFGVR